MKNLHERLLDFKAQQQAGKNLPCPRCGQETMKPRLPTNALSRLADLYVCDACGLDEAMLDFMNNPGTLYAWHAFQPKQTLGDFKEVTGKQAWKEIQETQASYLIKLYKRYRSTTHGDLEALRLEAMEHCKGVDKLWFEPFYLHYPVVEGTLQLEVKETQEGTEIIASLI